MGSGQTVCWLTVVDEYSCALLQAPTFPIHRICQLDVAGAQKAMITIFEKWGMPKHIKFDNGAPFGDPSRKSIPLLSVWLIGLGIQVIFNRPARPTDNSQVERMQSVTKRWSNPMACQHIEQIQSALEDSIDLQRNHFKLRRHGHKTRIELYPQLNTAYKSYQTDCFDLNKVYAKIAEGRWERLVSKNGPFYFYNQRFYVGKAYTQQVLQITFDLSNNKWAAYDKNGQLVKYFVVKNITEKIRCDLSKLSKN